MALQIIPEDRSENCIANGIFHNVEYIELGQFLPKPDEIIFSFFANDFDASGPANHWVGSNGFSKIESVYASAEPSNDEQEEAEEAPPMPQPPIPSEKPSDNEEKTPSDKKKKKEHPDDDQEEAEEAPVMPRPPSPSDESDK